MSLNHSVENYLNNFFCPGCENLLTTSLCLPECFHLVCSDCSENNPQKIQLIDLSLDNSSPLSDEKFHIFKNVKVICPLCKTKNSLNSNNFERNKNIETLASCLKEIESSINRKRRKSYRKNASENFCLSHKEEKLLYCENEGISFCPSCDSSHKSANHYATSFEKRMEIEILNNKFHFLHLKESQNHLNITQEKLEKEKENLTQKIKKIEENLKKISKYQSEIRERIGLLQQIERELTPIDWCNYRFINKLRETNNEFETKCKIRITDLINNNSINSLSRDLFDDNEYTRNKTIQHFSRLYPNIFREMSTIHGFVNFDSRILCENELLFISGLIANSHHINYVSLKKNNIQDMDTTFLKTAIMKSTSLQSLDLSHNKIGDEGCVRIASSIRNNKTLKYLALDSNPITDIGGNALLDALLINTPSFIFIGLSDCMVSSSIIDQIQNELYLKNVKVK